MEAARIADVVFDLPVAHPFSYSIPPDLTVAPGQRVRAPLGRATRAGLVVAVRTGSSSGVKPLSSALDSAPVMSRSQLDLARWIAVESCSTLGSTCLALLPPYVHGAAPARTPAEWHRGNAETPELFIGDEREARLRERVETWNGGVLVLTPDVASAAHWASRLGSLGRVVRLDSGAFDHERACAWTALATGDARIAVGTRSALLAPLSEPATLALVDEHDPAHRPPGPPGIHARDVVLRRSRVDGSRLLMTSATPSVEMWWRADSGRVRLHVGAPGPWPPVTIADTRSMLRADPLTPALGRAAREALGRGRRACLVVSRLTSALACDDCGGVLRCPACAIAIPYSRVGRTLGCPQCGRHDPAPDTCPTCAGRRLSVFGWGAERVEHAMRRRFPRARIARYDPDAMRGQRLTRQRAEAAHAEIVIGTRGALRLFEPRSLGLVGFVTFDQLLRIPDFRASERAFALAWAAAERVRPDGQVVIQSQNPDHYTLRALVGQVLAEFYKNELRFRAELAYPPFRRLCRVTTRGRSELSARALAETSARRLAEAGLAVYPPAADRRGLAWTVVAKGRDDLPAVVAETLADLGAGRRRVGDMVEIEVDPVD